MAKRCDICNLDLQDNNSYQGHLLGKRHEKNAQQSKFIQTLVQRSIFISHIPKCISSQILIKFFSQFGEITKYQFGSNHVVIEFKTSEPVKYLLTKPIFFNDIKLNIQPRIINDHKLQCKKDNKNTAPEAINDSEDLIYDNIKSIFEVESTFNDQLSMFLEKVAIKNYEIETRYETTCNDLDEIFQYVFPKCKTYRFGSTVSGLGFQNCDLDLYMDIGILVSQENNRNLGPNVISATAVFSEVKRILYARSNLFSKIVPIPRAKTPIIKFKYIPTNVSCDISFKNSLAVHNSQLIKFYLSLNQHLRPAMMVLKYWVSNIELRGGDKMSKYALTMLFIFYLQQPSVKLAPSVIDLKRRCVPEIIEGWQVNFDTTFTLDFKDESNNKNKSVPELLHGFFEFYANYDFKSNVICPVDSMSYNKILFEQAENLPDSMDRYKEFLKTRESPMLFPTTKPICVQDPNELNYNITGNVSAKYLENFQKYCAAAAKICCNAAENNYKALLPSIFSLLISKETKVNFSVYANHLLRVGLSEDFETRTDILDKKAFIRDNWFDIVCNFIKKYFEKVLKLEIQFIDPERELKQQKVEIQSDVHSKDQNKLIMHCSGNYSLWRDRSTKLNVLDPSKSLLEKEIEITNSLFEELNSKNKLLKIKFDFECHILKKSNPAVHINITLCNNNDNTKKIFSEVTHYIKNKMPDVLSKTLIHMQQFKKKTID